MVCVWGSVFDDSRVGEGGWERDSEGEGEVRKNERRVMGEVGVCDGEFGGIFGGDDEGGGRGGIGGEGIGVESGGYEGDGSELNGGKY